MASRTSTCTVCRESYRDRRFTCTGHASAGFAKTLADPGTPIVATATILDGIVLALAVFKHSNNYRSAVCHGVSVPFSQDELAQGAKMRALERVVESAAPGRWEHARLPNETEMATTAVVRMRVESARSVGCIVDVVAMLTLHTHTRSAKIRTGPPKDAQEVSSSKGVRELTKVMNEGRSECRAHG